MSTRTMPCWVALLPMLLGRPLSAQSAPHPEHRMYQLGDFRLESGATLPGARLLYVTRSEERRVGKECRL